MLEKLTNWWNADKIKMAQLTERLEQLEQAKAVKEAELTAAQQEAQEMSSKADALEEEVADLQEQVAVTDHSTSLEPWVEIKSERIDPIKGLVIELDWNDAFVQYLKDNGIDGRDDDTIVQKWIAMLYKDMMTGLESQAIEKSDRPRVNDFE